MDNEEIVMTPTKSGKTTTIKIEKVKKTQIDQSKVAHAAGGQHAGLVINKQGQEGAAERGPPHLQLEFKCFLVNQKTGKHVPESRVLKFWFSPETDYLDKVTGAYEFFKELVKPDNFPRDYVGFIKKVMKQLQQPVYLSMKKVDVELKQLEEHEGPPTSPDSSFRTASGLPTKDTRPRHVIVQEHLLMTLESAYPNILPVEDLAKMMEGDEQTVQEQLKMLEGKNLIKQMEPGKWVRKVLDEKTEVKIVQQMPMQTPGDKPSVAIITSKYYEKLAVDAMMDNKTTFVKYKTEGESTAYTIGYIGRHKIVSTKLPQIGRSTAAQISSGNTTTRLLGTFSDIEHVLLVGVGGGVPHYTDFYKHVRLGDVIVSTPHPQKGFTFIYCDKITHDQQRGQMLYTLKSWAPQEPVVQQIVEKLQDQLKSDVQALPLEAYIREGQELLKGQQVNFDRPSPDTDRLFMNIGGNDVIEVGHPPVPDDAAEAFKPGSSVLRLGPIGSGKPIVKDDALRMDFAARHECICYDTEFDQCLESIVGNRKDSFAFIRGVCDYLDGTKNVEWQPYSALAAAAFMKIVILNLPPPDQ